MSLLRVANYFLRSILPLTFDSSKPQSTLQVVLKLLYLCIVLSGDACLGMFETFTTLFTSSSSSGNEGLAGMEDAIICLGAYEGLGRCLMPGGPSSKSIRGALSWGELILLPFSGGALILPHRQLVKIVMCNWCHFMRMYDKLASNGRSPPSFILHPVSSMRRALVSIRTVSHFKNWCRIGASLHYAVFVMGEVDSEARILNADALRHVKKAFQILWGAARFIEHLCAVSNSPALRKSCLDIQSEAIHFVLRSLKKVFQHSPYLLSEERAPSAVK